VFVGRAQTLAALQAHLDAVRDAGRGRIVAVRGRRQVGKSAAVERFVEATGVPYVFTTGVYRGSTRQQLDDFAAAAGESRTPLPDAATLFASPPASWRDALGLVGVAARSGPVVVVCDELPWLAQADPSLEGVLQAVWDRTLEPLPVLLVLVGSDVTMMERLATYGRPLYGRVRELVVEPLHLGEVAQALPDRSPAQVVDSYLVVGGFPRLVTDLATSGLSTADYVRAAFADPFSPLLTTGRLVMDAEFPDAPAAAHVLSAIGADDSGHPRFSDLTPALTDPAGRKAAETAVTRALALLSGPKALVEKETPAWTGAGSRLRRYRVSDPYLRFWLRYGNKQTELVARGRADIPLGRFERDWSSWRGRSVEPLVRQSLLRLAATDPDLTEVQAVAPWWNRDAQTEVDVVATTTTTTAVLGTIKWRSARGVTPSDMTHLAHARDAVPRSSDARLAAVCRDGTRPAGADLLFTAADIVAAW